MWHDKEFVRKLRELMIPIALQTFMLAAVSAGDAAMLGFIDEKAMAAVSLAGNIQFVETLFLNAIACAPTPENNSIRRIGFFMLTVGIVKSNIVICSKFILSPPCYAKFTGNMRYK